jgi:hypothetical protein
MSGIKTSTGVNWADVDSDEEEGQAVKGTADGTTSIFEGIRARAQASYDEGLDGRYGRPEESVRGNKAVVS